MTYLQAFAQYMEDLGVATRGQDLFIGEVPRQSDDNIDQGQWWIVAAGGTSVGTDYNQWQRTLFINVFYRDRDPLCVIEKFEEFRHLIHHLGCEELDGYKVIKIDVSTEFVDNDIDSEDNKVGVMVVRVILEQERI